MTTQTPSHIVNDYRDTVSTKSMTTWTCDFMTIFTKKIRFAKPFMPVYTVRDSGRVFFHKNGQKSRDTVPL